MTNSFIDSWNNRPKDCTCEPPQSSRPSKCKIHCSCMKNGRYIKGSKRIDGQCKICGNFPLYTTFPFPPDAFSTDID